MIGALAGESVAVDFGVEVGVGDGSVRVGLAIVGDKVGEAVFIAISVGDRKAVVDITAIGVLWRVEPGVLHEADNKMISE